MTTSPTLDLLTQAAGLLNGEEAAALLAALAPRLAAPAPDAVLTQREAATLDGRGEVYVPLVQFATAAGQPRGVYVKALSTRVCMLAEQAATTRGRDGAIVVNEWRQMAEQIAGSVTRPRITVDTLLDWNVEAFYALHRAIWRITALPAEVLEYELTRLAGGPPPPPAEPPARPEWGVTPAGPPVPEPVAAPGHDGDGAGPPPVAADEQPGGPEPGGAGA
jgi:hypothetical protein